MSIETKDKARFQKVSCENILDLALIKPNGYENRFVATSVQLEQLQVFWVEVVQVRKTGKTLQLEVHAPNIGQHFSCVIFHYKAYHLSLFQPKKQMHLQGKLTKHGAFLQMSQPKNIVQTDINQIYVKYSSKIAKNLITKYLTHERLEAYPLKSTVAKLLCEIHFPTNDFMQKYDKDTYPNSPTMKPYLNALKYTEMLNYLQKMQSKKREFSAIRPLANDISEWQKKLPFTLTDEQNKTIADIQEDFTSAKSARRMIVGDVGCGKSIIIFACALLAYPNKSALMAPTTVLANQLYNEAKKFLPPYLKIILLTNKNADEAKDAHLIVSTHTILYQDIQDISLVMIDEQHRFGSTQRQVIESFSKVGNKRAHFLQFSATPIPRTMAMIESSLIDFSFIRQVPFAKDVQTKLISKAHFKELIVHIKEQIASGQQVIIVYPLVETSEAINYMSIEEARDFWTKNFEGVYVTFGKDKHKEEVLKEFSERGNLLLATTLIEVGISLPKLSSIVIVGAERLGLATLHQLRGRVGRYGQKGYCFLYSNNPTSQRLQDFSGITSGFEIAELDLRYRESGDILGGVKQSGKSFEYINLSEDGEIIQEVQKDLAQSSLAQ
mgnify:FL=1